MMGILDRLACLSMLAALSAGCAATSPAESLAPGPFTGMKGPFKAAAGITSRPNIIFVFADDHAAHAIGAYGSRINRTPNIDRLAAGGMLFRNCFVTNSICAPSRAVILTGKHSHINGIIDNSQAFDGSQQTFPKLLQRAGYQTALVGKWHLQSDPTGFDHWEILLGQGTYYNPRFRTAGGFVDQTGYTTDIITDRALEWLRSGRDPDRPFLLMYQHKAPHREWLPDAAHMSLYESVDIPEPSTLFDDWRGRTSAARRQTMTIAQHLNALDLKLRPPEYLNEAQADAFQSLYRPRQEAIKRGGLRGRDLVRWKYQCYIKDYLRCVASIDDNLGRVMQYLDDAGLAGNTVVVYSSDQGFFLGDHGWFDKRWMYEESLRMPLIVRWPGVVPPGSENHALVQNLDLAETFLEIAGEAVPDDMQGHSLLPLLQGETPPSWRTSVYYHYYEFPAWHDVRRHYGIRTDRYKLIHYYDIGEWELFDLERDPREMRSVYNDRNYRSVVDRLRAELDRLRKDSGAEDYREPPVPLEPALVPVELVLQYDFDSPGENTVVDRSGNRNHAPLNDATIVTDHGRSVLSLQSGEGPQLSPVPESLNPTYKPLTVGAWCRPDTGDGVLVSHGTANFGYSLYLESGFPCFVLRAGQQLFLVRGGNRLQMGRWSHLAATIDPRARITLYVDAERAGQLRDGFFVSQRPGDFLAIGSDPGGRVGEYSSPMHFRGLLDEVRLYWGAIPRRELRSWARR